MKATKFLTIFGLLALVALSAARPADDEYEYDEEPAPPPKKVPARGPLVGRRNPLAKNNKPAASTTTTTAAPVEEEAPAEGDYEEEPQPVETSSTTEAPKKFIKSGIVRPFRSNDDLLATLKRRREQVVSNKQSKPVVAPSEPKEETDAAEPAPKESKPAASSSSGRRGRFNKTKASNEVPAEEASAVSTTKTATRGRFSTRS